MQLDLGQLLIWVGRQRNRPITYDDLVDAETRVLAAEESLAEERQRRERQVGDLLGELSVARRVRSTQPSPESGSEAEQRDIRAEVAKWAAHHRQEQDAIEDPDLSMQHRAVAEAFEDVLHLLGLEEETARLRFERDQALLGQEQAEARIPPTEGGSGEEGEQEEGICPECDHDIRPHAWHARDWLIRWDDGRLCACPPEQFEELFEPASTQPHQDFGSGEEAQPVKTHWLATRGGESWLLGIVPDADGNRSTVAVEGRYANEPGTDALFHAWLSPKQAREIAEALRVRADEVEPPASPSTPRDEEGK